MTVLLVVNTRKDIACKTAMQAAALLHQCGVDLLLQETAGFLQEQGLKARVLPNELAYAACDLVLCVGGDGTMLHAARYTMIHKKPMLGINTGRLGFLTLVEPNELEQLRRLASGQYTVDERNVIQACPNGLCPKDSWLALNDIVLFKESPEKTISLDIFCDDILVSSFRGDGVIFATPTGSTAYSLSAGGPVLDARLNAIVVTQICAHIVHTPPLVVAAERTLKAVSTGGEEERVIISCDGSTGLGIGQGEEVILSSSEYKVPLIQFNNAEQLESIDRKLKGR